VDENKMALTWKPARCWPS